MALEGVDVSHHNGVIDWAKAREAGIAFAFIKATEGVDHFDPKGATNAAKCRQVGIVPGMYHFYRHDETAKPEDQAANFLRHLGPQPGDLIPAIDVEGPGDKAGNITYSKDRVVERVGIVVRAVQAAIGRAPLIYTYRSVWADVTGDSHAFADECPLWIANYGHITAPRLVGGWTDYAVWQYTDQGTVEGIGSGVDRDRLNGDQAALDALRIGMGTGTGTAAGTGTGTATATLTRGGKAVLNQDGNVRDAPGTESPLMGALPRGTVVTIVDGPQSVRGRDWWKIDDGAGKIGWSSSKVLNPA